MITLKWYTWLAVLLILAVAGEALAWLVAAQGMPVAGGVIAWAARVAAAGWVGYGLWRWREQPWVRRTTLAVIATVLALLLLRLCVAMGWHGGAIAVAGVYAMAAGFVLGLLLIRLLLSGGHPILGVARTLIDEAVRMRVALVFIIALLLALPALPLAMDPAELLRYRIQSFLSWSLMAVGALLSLMTVFLAVATITRELHDRQVFLTLTKPVARVQYLAGKWLGIALLNLLLVGVCGGGIYVFTQVLAQQPPAAGESATAVREQVLAARIAVGPRPSAGVNLPERLEQRLLQYQQIQPEVYGEPGTPPERLPGTLRREVERQVKAEWMSVGPRQTRTFRFENVPRPRGDQGQVQLRLEPNLTGASPDERVYLEMRINGRPYRVPPLAEANYHVLPIPAAYFDEHNTLEIAIINRGRDPSVQPPGVAFNPSDGLQILSRADSFEANLLRGLAMLWLRLGFLAMLGLAAGAFMSFPTACLLGLLVYIAAASSGYLYESLNEYAYLPGAEQSSGLDPITAAPARFIERLAEGEYGDAFKVIVRVIGSAFMLFVPSFADYNPGPLLADGLLVSWRHLGHAAVWVGAVWTGAMGVIAWLIFRNRELARVTV
ncbi:MAG: hypothetical protein WD009_05410 [Phycisphaeraceae bacterium]